MRKNSFKILLTVFILALCAVIPIIAVTGALEGPEINDTPEITTAAQQYDYPVFDAEKSVKGVFTDVSKVGKTKTITFLGEQIDLRYTDTYNFTEVPLSVKSEKNDVFHIYDCYRDAAGNSYEFIYNTDTLVRYSSINAYSGIIYEERETELDPKARKLADEYFNELVKELPHSYELKEKSCAPRDNSGASEFIYSYRINGNYVWDYVAITVCLDTNKLAYLYIADPGRYEKYKDKIKTNNEYKEIIFKEHPECKSLEIKDEYIYINDKDEIKYRIFFMPEAKEGSSEPLVPFDFEIPAF